MAQTQGSGLLHLKRTAQLVGHSPCAVDTALTLPWCDCASDDTEQDPDRYFTLSDS